MVTGGPAVTAIERIARVGLVPVVEIPDRRRAAPLAIALRGTGLVCIEITFRTPGAAEAIRAIRDEYPDLLVGAGTILTPGQLDAALAAGAGFVVAPGFNPSVVEHALDVGATILPGVCTPTEIEAAMARGLRHLKFFPAEACGGIAFLKAIHAPYPSLGFVPTGGISSVNLAGYLSLPNVIACGGSWMVRRDLLLAGDFKAVERLAAQAVALVAAARSRSAPAATEG